MKLTVSAEIVQYSDMGSALWRAIAVDEQGQIYATTKSLYSFPKAARRVLITKLTKGRKVVQH